MHQAAQVRHRDHYDRNPLCKVFGDDPRRLSPDNEHEYPIDRRIESIYGFLTQKALAFASTLSPRERANCDVEDTLEAIWIELYEKDSKWEPGRGRYITFASSLIRRLFVSLRDEARTVQSPGNSSGRLKTVDGNRDGVSERVARTADKIRRTADHYAEVMPDSVAVHDDPSAEPSAADDRSAMITAVIDGVGSLANPYEAAILGARYGLWGSEAKTYPEIADQVGIDVAACRTMAAKAKAKIRRYLSERGLEPS